MFSSPATLSEIDEFLRILQQIQPDIVPTNCTKAVSLISLTQLKNFMDYIRHYMFSIKKCGATDCIICKPPRLPRRYLTLFIIYQILSETEMYTKNFLIFFMGPVPLRRINLLCKKVIQEFLSIVLASLLEML